LKKNQLDVRKIFEDALGEKMQEYTLPAPSFSIMQTEIIAYDKEKSSLSVKIPVLKEWLNPFGTMQGGFIIGAMDNALGALSMLIAPLNLTRNIESKLMKAITMDLEFIYITAILIERKKRRLIFDVVVKDKDDTVYAKAKITNWIIEKEDE